MLKTGLGQLHLLGANTYGGKTIISNGTVRINDDSSLGTAPGAEADGHLTLNGGRLLLATSSTAIDANRNIELGVGHGTLSALSSKTLTVNSKIKGAGNLIINTTGDIVLEGVNTYAGDTIIESGTLKISDDSGLGADPGTPTEGKIALSGGTLQAAETFALDSDRGITLEASSVIEVNNTKEMSYGGVITGGNALTKAGAGTLVLTGANDYSGGTTVSGGTLKGTTTGLQGDIEVDPGDDLEFDQETSGTYAGEISGGGNLTKSGGGTVTLSGANLHTGTTDVDGGALIINGSHSGGGTYTVSGGTLGGSGSISAAVSVTSGGTVRGGSDGSPDILDLNSTLTLASGATLEAELTGSATGTGYSQIDVAGNVVLGGATLEAELTYVPAQAAKIVLIKGAGTTSGAFNGIAEGETVTLDHGGTDYTFYVYYNADGDAGETTGGNDVMLRDTRLPPSLFRFR